MSKLRWLPFLLTLVPAAAVAHDFPRLPISGDYGEGDGGEVSAGLSPQGDTYSYATPSEIRGSGWSCEPIDLGQARAPKVALICARSGENPTYEEAIFKENRQTGSLDIIFDKVTYEMSRCEVLERLPRPRPSALQKPKRERAEVRGGIYNFFFGQDTTDQLADLLTRVEAAPD